MYGWKEGWMDIGERRYFVTSRMSGVCVCVCGKVDVCLAALLY